MLMDPLSWPAGVRTGVKLAPFTTWQVGGPAAYFTEPESVEALQAAIATARQAQMPWAVIGRGSNLLVSDAGFPGLVVRMGNAFAAVTVEGDRLTAQAGIPCAQFVMAGLNAGLGGLEGLVGVPGSIGGAIAMNASCHGVAVSDGFESGRVLRPDGSVEIWSRDDFRFAYRHSRLHEEQGVVLEGTWRMKPVDKAEGRAEVLRLQQWRHAKQPTNVPTGGSTFRNPDGSAAGALIEAVGAKGLQMGRAQVSEKHANFIVNLGGATADDINALIGTLQRRVWDQHGIRLHPEVVGLGLSVGLGSDFFG
ncbi:MAG TPA: UDP-N-acetylmuramate dehydrogenase [Oscillatoriaceae cyanobacterium]